VAFHGDDDHNGTDGECVRSLVMIKMGDVHAGLALTDAQDANADVGI
jgi:hypothetical protein